MQMTHHLSLDDNMEGSLNISSKLERQIIEAPFACQDRIINNEGNMLLDMCRNSMLILNGRCGDDKFNGPMTFRNQAFIDYSILSFQSLQFIKSFRVLELDALFSDAHSLISTSLCFKNDLEVQKSVPINTKTRKPRLPEVKRTHFIENLNRIKIKSLLASITQTSQTTDSLSQDKVNSLCNEFSEIFNESANSCNNYKNGSNTSNNKKTWFRYQSAKSRKAYHRAKKNAC